MHLIKIFSILKKIFGSKIEMEDFKKPAKSELFNKWIGNLDGSSLYETAAAAAYLGDSSDPDAVEPLLRKALSSSNWLIQDFAVRALMTLARKLPEAETALSKVNIIEPPEHDRIFEIKQTAESPHIILDFERGRFSISGKGTGDNESTRSLFDSVSRELDLFDKMYPHMPLIICLYLKSFDTPFDKELFKMLKRIGLHQETIIYWHYEFFGDSITYVGEDFEMITGLKFIYVEIPDSGNFSFL